jgi:hypothetical protein
MVAKIKARKSISKALNYNEAKVRAGVGELLLASGFGCDVADLNFHEKLRRFELLNQRNDWIETNTLHIFLSFPPGEDLAPDLLQRLSLDYMDRIGFGDQPFLVYQHHDTRHAHIHIVTTRIRPDGEAINIHNIGQYLSDPVREALEYEYGLTRARGRQTTPSPTEPPDLAARVQEVTGTYKFTSLEGLNVILAQNGMTAWPGNPGSAIRSNHGLLYSRIDADGNRIGTPIKSSDLVTRPTLAWLEKRFELNRVRKLVCKDRVTEILKGAFDGKRAAPAAILGRLKQRHITLQPRRDHDGNLDSVYIVDNRNKAVFNAEELGFSPETLLTRLGLPLLPAPGFEAPGQKNGVSQKKPAQPPKPSLSSPSGLSQGQTAVAAKVAFLLLSSQTGVPGTAGDEPHKKKKRKKRSL